MAVDHEAAAVMAEIYREADRQLAQIQGGSGAVATADRYGISLRSDHRLGEPLWQTWHDQDESPDMVGYAQPEERPLPFIPIDQILIEPPDLLAIGEDVVAEFQRTGVVQHICTQPLGDVAANSTVVEYSGAGATG